MCIRDSRLEPPLPRAQGDLRHPPVVHVQDSGNPACDFPLYASNWSSARQVPAIDAVVAPYPVFDLARRRRFECVPPNALELFPVVRVNHSQRTLVVERLLVRESCELVPPIVHPLEAALRI